MTSSQSTILSSTKTRQKTWLLVAMLLALIGLGISSYSTIHHLEVKAKGATGAGCNINDTINCDVVAQSEYSEIVGIPLGVWGGAYFAAILALVTLAFFSPKSRTVNIQAYAGLVAIGLATSVILASISALVLKTVCLACTGIYFVTFVQLLALIIWRNEIPGQFSVKNLANGGLTASVVVALVVAGFAVFKPALMPDATASAPTNKEPGSIQQTQGSTVSEASLNLSSMVAEIPVTKSPYAGLGEDYRYGNDNAKVTVVEFADFMCPACARMGMTLASLKATLGDRVLFVFRNYPLDSKCNAGGGHEHSCAIATMARCAGQYGKFWEYHDLAFENQRSASESSATSWAARVGLTQAQIDTCLKSADIQAKIKDDIQVANAAGVNSTPTVFINGRRYLGSPTPEALRLEIESMLARQ
jgi:protein-disulfide isomerase